MHETAMQPRWTVLCGSTRLPRRRLLAASSAGRVFAKLRGGDLRCWADLASWRAPTLPGHPTEAAKSVPLLGAMVEWPVAVPCLTEQRL
jgi:hypothetical protein